MADSWWKRLLNNDDSNENSSLSHPEQDYVTSKKGRIEDSTRHVQVRMLNQYPQTSRFEEEHPRVRPQRNQRHEDEEQKPVAKEKKKFVPTNIPSPVFGFHSRKNGVSTLSEDLSIPAFKRRQIDSLLPEERNSTNDQSTKEESVSIEDREPSHQEIDLSESETNEQLKEKEKAFQDTTDVLEQLRKTTHPSYPEKETSTVPSDTQMNNTITNQTNTVPGQKRQARTSQSGGTRYQSKPTHADHERRSKPQLPYNVLFNPPKRLTEYYKNKEKARQQDYKHDNGGSRQPQEENNLKTSPSSADQLDNHNSLNLKTDDFLPPSLDLLSDPVEKTTDETEWCKEKEEILRQTLHNFNVKGKIVDIVQGPTVTRFELKLHPGVKVNKIVGLTEDIKLSLAARQIRIAPVPGKNTIGIEIPNAERKPVYLKKLLQSETFQKHASPLTVALGRDVSGKTIVTDLAKMPHGLIAGATGSGKSVCIHSLILSLIYKATPERLRLILIDPKVVELAAYRQLPHLAAPVLNQPKEASLALKWAVDEMERRYQLFAKHGVRDISRYNESIQGDKMSWEEMPYIVIIIDELADLMMVSPHDVEEAICRIAQKARAAGIHMILATQRPSVDVITGLIKSNIPTRIAFSVSSQADSRTILDSAGADRLLGQGDMLFSENGARAHKRVQGCFVSDEEIDRVTKDLGERVAPPYLFDENELTKQTFQSDDEEDELFEEACQFVIDQGQASISSVQRRFRIGYNRAARLIDQMESHQIISEANGSKPRQILMQSEMFYEQVLGKEMNES